MQSTNTLLEQFTIVGGLLSLGIFLMGRDIYRNGVTAKQKKFIETYQFSLGFKNKFAKTKDYLSSQQQELVFLRILIIS